MPKRPLSPCRFPGCRALVERPGYCHEHQREAAVKPRENFARLDDRKTNAQRAFYSSRRWTEVSLAHRQAEPLCRRCKAKGRVVAAQLVHHNPPVEMLIARGLSPYDGEYLESLCNKCHMADLRAKKNK